MTCDPRLVSFYRDGELPPDQRREVDRHLSTCGDCAATLRGYLEVARAIRSLPSVAAPPGLEAGLRQRIAEYEASRRGLRWLRGIARAFSPAVAAAGVVLAFLVAYRPGAVEIPVRAPTLAPAPPPAVAQAPVVVRVGPLEATASLMGLDPSKLANVPSSIRRLYQGSPTLQAQLGTPSQGSKTVILREQSFQGGVALWRSDTREIYVLNRVGGAWAVYPDTWKPGDPVQVAATPPPGAMVPDGGFGALWRSHPDVRTRLGWAVYEPRGFGGAVQVFDRGTVIWSPHGLLYVLFSDGTWKTYPDAAPV